MAFQPIANFAGHEHVLNAVPCFVHNNGNMYGIAIDKIGGVTQDLVVYRTVPGSTVKHEIKRYVGGVDSRAQIAAGGCVILQDGSLEVWASAVPPLQPNITKTGFVGVWDRVAGVDEPWTSGGAQGPIGPPGPPGNGGITRLPAIALSPAWDARVLTTGVLVDIPSVFNVPVAQSYLVRFCATAPLANVIARAGTEANPFFYTICTQAPNVRFDGQGWIPGPQAWISPAQGTPTVWLQVEGYS